LLKRDLDFTEAKIEKRLIIKINEKAHRSLLADWINNFYISNTATKCAPWVRL